MITKDNLKEVLSNALVGEKKAGLLDKLASIMPKPTAIGTDAPPATG